MALARAHVSDDARRFRGLAVWRSSSQRLTSPPKCDVLEDGCSLPLLSISETHDEPASYWHGSNTEGRWKGFGGPGACPRRKRFRHIELPSIEQPTAARRRPARDVAPGAHPSLDHVAPDAHVQKRRIELTQRSVRELRSGSLASVLAGFGGSDSPTARASAATLTAARTVTVRSLKACLAATFFICSSCWSTHVAGRITTIYGETR